MSYGYTGRILKVDLTKELLTIDKNDEKFYRTYMGGRNIGAYYLLKDSPPNVDPFSPDNIVVFAVSIITGVNFPGVSKYSIVTKSPLTGGYAESEAGGYWGPELKFAGFDAIVIRGKAKNPVYLWIHDGEAEIKDAKHIWGKTTGESEALIKEELGSKIYIAQIGPAGENLVRYACVLNDLRYANGRAGTGAVLGSKNLKAIVVKGASKPTAFNPKAILELRKNFSKEWRKNDFMQSLREVGTAIVVSGLNAGGMFPTKNFNEGVFKYASKISGETLRDTMMVGKEGCFACPVRCKPIIKVEGIDSKYGSPEYETIGTLGSYCCINDLSIIAKGNELCNKYGMDTISTGGMIAFAMECYENGVIGPSDTENMELRFGRADVLLRLIEMIAHRKGIGDILAEGPVYAIKKFGPESGKFAMHVKGQPFPAHEPRGKGFGIGLSYAIAPQGADHCTVEHDACFENESVFLKNVYPMGILEPINRFNLGPEKIRLFVYLECLNSLHNILGICNFTGSVLGINTLPRIAKLVSAVTGWETSGWELVKVGERGINLAKCFNVREGFTRSDDRLPQRMFEPLKGGVNEGKYIEKKDFESALTMYYEMRGWDIERGIPKRSKLSELNIEWALES